MTSPAYLRLLSSSTHRRLAGAFVLALAATACAASEDDGAEEGAAAVNAADAGTGTSGPLSNWLLEDCKYVSLNNALGLVASSADPSDRLSLSMGEGTDPVSRKEVLDASGFVKRHTVFVHVDSASGQRKKTVGMEISLDDPESGFCHFRGSAVLAPEDHASPRFHGKLSDDDRYYSPCTIKAVNAALADFYESASGGTAIPLVGFGSVRFDQAVGADGVEKRDFHFLMSKKASFSVEEENPDRDAFNSTLPIRGATVVSLTKNGAACTIDRVAKTP